MNNLDLDKELVKAALKELLIEDPTLIKKALHELLSDNQDSDQELIQHIINKNFKRFDKTFKALA